jgi:ferredoxin-NADP reductase
MQVSAIPRRLIGSSVVSALTTPNPVDRYLELVNPRWSAREVKATVVAADRQTDKSVTFTLRPNANWKGFKAGQHVGLTVQINGILRTRFYSIASSEHRKDGCLEFTMSKHPDGLVSSWLLENADPGAVVHITQAQGEFVLPDERPDSIVLISGGSGITPAMSMIRTLADDNYDGELAFINYATDAKRALYESELAELQYEHGNFRILRSHTRTGGADLEGHFTRKHLRAATADPWNAAAYACGPTPLIEAVEKLWEKDGNRAQLETEHFAPPKLLAPSGSATGQLTFATSEEAVANDGTTILQQAEAAGLTPKAGCRMGICHTCVCKVESGEVRHVLTGETKTVENELVQICVNAPVGDVEINL